MTNKDILDDLTIFSSENYQDDLTAKERYFSMFLDHVILCGTLLPLIFLGYFLNQNSQFVDLLLLISTFTIYLSKDFLKGRSVAKRITGQVVIDQITGLPASEIKCVIRNLTIPVWLIEIIGVGVTPNKRIGDSLAGTKVVRTSKAPGISIFTDIKTYRPSIKLLLSLLIAIGYTLLVFGPFDMVSMLQEMLA
ncbi:MAG: RDD family protein [Bacteroidota bacterium]